MNEQIKKLYDEAWAETTDHYGTMQKFAELIVKECCDVLQSEVIQHDGYGYNQFALHNKIKKHFGVKE